MSTSAADPNKIYKNSFHWRNDSGELDVFEAARYFSSAADQAVPAYINGVREDRHQAARPARRSLDVPIMIRSNPIPPEYNHHHHHIIDQKQLIIKDQNKKFKQPSSPGGRLASFLNSLFNQTSLKKKKKSKSGGGAATKDFEEESPNGRRKRRSSISHFRITTTSNKTAAAAAADKGSGFRTPPPYANTPTKAYKELARFADHHAVSVGEKNGGADSEKNVGKLRKWSEEDDGGESDSSSDLFDLPNLELDFFSSGLPVYETTHMERITIGTPIPSAM